MSAMMLHVSNTKGHHGRALLRVLEQVWATEGTTRNAWALKHGLNGATILRWEDNDPSMELMAKLAEVLRRPLTDILIFAEYITAEEAGGRVPAPIPEPASVEEAIARDEALSEDAKIVLTTTYRQFAGGATGRILDTRRRRRTKP